MTKMKTKSVHSYNSEEIPIIHYTPEYMELVKRAKADYILHGTDPRTVPGMRREIAESWVHSHQFLPDPGKTDCPQYGPEQATELAKKYSLLIKAAQPVLDGAADLLSAYGHYVSMYSPEGIVLCRGRSLTEVAAPFKPWTALGLQNIGTTSHALVIKLHRPVQLLTQEHYSTRFLEKSFGVACPIYNERQEIMSVIAIKHNFEDEDEIWQTDLDELQINLLGWLMSLSFAVDIQCRLQKTTESLEIAFNASDDAVISIDKNGNLICANQRALSFLNIPSLKNIQMHKITSYIPEEAEILNRIRRWEPFSFLKSLFVIDGRVEQRLVSGKLAASDAAGIPNAMVLNVLNPETERTLSTNNAGSPAATRFADIYGISTAISAAKKKGAIFARSNENVLLTGESGTGKDLFAQAIFNDYIHNMNLKGAYVAVNCAALPRTLLESELFGYEKGAFTGADKKGKLGKIELANDGVLFLDEIGDMPYELQGVFLRVLQNKEVVRIGGSTANKVNFKLIAATNQNLAELVKKKLFREDLYYRLSVLTIEIPALRERGEDVALLAKYFASKTGRKIGYDTVEISEDALRAIVGYDWPGNVRELKNAMTYSVNLTGDGVIQKSHLPSLATYGVRSVSVPESTTAPPPPDLPADSGPETIFFTPESMRSILNSEKAVVENALRQTNYDVQKAADLLAISRATMYRKMKKYGIRKITILR